MKSVTIKGEDGQKLIKVYHNGKGEYFVERCSTVGHFVCVITLDNRERITIPTRPKGGWVAVIKLDCVGVTGDVGKISEEVTPAASAGYAIPRDSEENLLLDTIVRIRIATKLVTPMLTELPGEVRRLINDLEERVEKWKTWYDSAASDAKDWRRDAQKMFGIMHNDILSAMDDCIELGMDAEQMRSVVKKIIEKTKLPDKA